ncbi:FAD binding domain-containing protein [Rhodococcus sp. 24CO]|uniref:FAD binding domain-containing protein n=1 Tax=Rhodococcus sp. 24CO TaxID=3117460 RepID=UPI003D34CF8A
MDLHTVDQVLVPATRTDLPGPSTGVGFIGGGTWLYSEPQPHLSTLVDLAGFGWESLTVNEQGLEIAATCTIEELCRSELVAPFRARQLFRDCADALLASWKVLRHATVGGNIALSFPAGAMTTMAVTLDGELTVWQPGGSEYRVAVKDFVTGDGTNTLGVGDIIRCITLPTPSLLARTALRKLAQTSLGRSAVVVAGRKDAAGFTLSVTAATRRPHVLRFDAHPSASELADALRVIPADCYFTDVHGSAPWRESMTALLAEEVREELT